MKDIDKLKTLLKEFGVYSRVASSGGTANKSLLVIAEDFSDLRFNWDDDEENSKDQKPIVKSYSGFYCYFVFDKESGKFESIGIFEQ